MNPNDTMSEPRAKGGNAKKIIAIIIIVLLIGGFIVYKKKSVTPEAKAKAETATVLESLSKLMIIPAGDEPAIFDVKDPAQLTAQQPFFTGAVVGDKLLVFPKAAKAIIYSPSRNKIVNSGPVTYGQDQGAPAGTQPAPETPVERAPATRAPVAPKTPVKK